MWIAGAADRARWVAGRGTVLPGTGTPAVPGRAAGLTARLPDGAAKVVGGARPALAGRYAAAGWSGLVGSVAAQRAARIAST
jgi:hypothetical protein